MIRKNPAGVYSAKASNRAEVIHSMVEHVTGLGLVKDQSWLEAWNVFGTVEHYGASTTTRLVLFEFFNRFLRGTGRVFRPLAPPAGVLAEQPVAMSPPT